MSNSKLNITGLSDKRRYVPNLNRFVTIEEAKNAILKRNDTVDTIVLTRLDKASRNAMNELEMGANFKIAALTEEFILTQGIEYIIEEGLK